MPRADSQRTATRAHDRIDDLMVELRQHLAVCSQESRAQNSRLRRVEAILIGSAGATIVLLISVLVR
jgi:hypothetical protein